MTDFARNVGLRGGDTVYLEGTFNEWIYIDLSLSFGSKNQFLRFTSLSASTPAVINAPNTNHGIALMAYNNNMAGGTWIQIDNLVIKGSGSTSNNGINIYTQSSIGLDTFYLYNNDISGFNQGIRASRLSSAVPLISNFWPYSNKLHNNAGAGLAAVGVSSAFIYYCESYSNGAQGFYISDSTNVYLGYDNSHDNRMAGYTVDAGSSFVYLLNSASSNNFFLAYQISAHISNSIRNDGAVDSIFVSGCTSYADGNGYQFALNDVWTDGIQSATNIVFSNFKATVTGTRNSYSQWGQGNSFVGFWLFGSYTMTTSNAVISFPSATSNCNLSCNSANSPACVCV